eukprot:g5779.t1
MLQAIGDELRAADNDGSLKNIPRTVTKDTKLGVLATAWGGGSVLGGGGVAGSGNRGKHGSGAVVTPEGFGAMYDDGDMPLEAAHDFQTVSCRMQTQIFLNETPLGMILDLINIVLSIFSCVTYVMETYNSSMSTDSTWVFIEFGMCVWFTLDYMLNMFVATRVCHHIFSFMAMVDILSTVPGYLDFLRTVVDGLDGSPVMEDLRVLEFLRVLRVLRILRINKLHRVLHMMENDISRELFSVALTIISVLFFASGLIHMFENQYMEAHRWSNPDLPAEFQFHTVIYFIIVTVSTVGYGDHSPESNPAQWAVVFLIVGGLVFVPQESRKIIQLMSMTTKYQRARHAGSRGDRHVVVTGEVNLSSTQTFLREMFHKDHGIVDLTVVILSPAYPTPNFETFMKRPKVSSRLKYLQGSAMSPADLERCQASSAESIFVLANKYCASSDEQDSSTILQALAIKRFVLNYASRRVPLCMQIMRPENQMHVLEIARVEGGDGDGKNQPDSVICVEKIKMDLIGRSCVCPGLCTMVTSLVSSSDQPSAKELSLFPEWLQEFLRGSGNEIYRKQLPGVFAGWRFLDLAVEVYEELGALLFGLEISTRDGKHLEPRVLINPTTMRLPRFLQRRSRDAGLVGGAAAAAAGGGGGGGGDVGKNSGNSSGGGGGGGGGGGV